MNLKKIIVDKNFSIREAIKKMDEAGIGFICISDNQKIVGVISDGDIRRAFLNEVDLNITIDSIMNSRFKYLNHLYKYEDVEKIFGNSIYNHIPILKNGFLVDIITKDKLFSISTDKVAELCIDSQVVIMAGGKGSRLEPFTNIMPKPLIPIGKKPIIEIIIDEYLKYGISDFFISVNYKANMIKAYFEDFSEDINIEYIQEDKPLGTAGALKFVENKIEKTFFVSNCDIIIKNDYNEIIKFHKEGKYDLTLIASMQHFKIPYGVIDIQNGGILNAIREKPQFDYLVNTGMYVLEPEVLRFIPKNEFFHITHLIEKLKSSGKKIGVFPVSEGSWIDIGQWDEYKNFMNLLK